MQTINSFFIAIDSMVAQFTGCEIVESFNNRKNKARFVLADIGKCAIVKLIAKRLVASFLGDTP